jgi:two-component system response regulator RegA
VLSAAGAPSLLIADPSAGARHALATDFRRKGYEVWAADRLSGALPVVAIERPDLVISELRFEDGTWLELFVGLKAEAPAARLIVLTSQASVATVVGAIRRGVAAYVTKPATADQVLAALVAENPAPPEAPAPPRWLTLDEAIWEYINQTLDSAGSISAAARRLGVDRRSLRRMLAKYSQLR